MRNVATICRRELQSYFTSPLAYVFIVIFLAASGALTFYVGGFIERGTADLSSFFQFHPWLYLFLIPAVGMRLWAEERKTGTLEFLMTLPVSNGEAVVGKFLAGWLFTGTALLLTFPFWLTVNYLGNPDNGVILTSYLGSWLMAGGFLAISAAVSALTRNQVVAFVVASFVCFLLLVTGLDLVRGLIVAWAPEAVVRAVAELSILANYQSLTRGVLELATLVFFASLIGVSLVVNTALVELKKGV
jgi:ABC-2 type transport system permease protein